MLGPDTEWNNTAAPPNTSLVQEDVYLICLAVGWDGSVKRFPLLACTVRVYNARTRQSVRQEKVCTSFLYDRRGLGFRFEAPVQRYLLRGRYFSPLPILHVVKVPRPRLKQPRTRAMPLLGRIRQLLQLVIAHVGAAPSCLNRDWILCRESVLIVLSDADEENSMVNPQTSVPVSCTTVHGVARETRFRFADVCRFFVACFMYH